MLSGNTPTLSFEYYKITSYYGVKVFNLKFEIQVLHCTTVC